MNWKNKLSKQLRDHLKEANVITIKDLLVNREHQKNLGIRCLDCEAIERQLIREDIL